MKCLCLWQPYASLIAIERVAIHATLTNPFVERLLAAGNVGTLAEVNGQLPLGAIVCTAVIDSCTEMTANRIEAMRRADPDEIAFGLWRPGRFAIALRDVERFAAPIPFKARQGKFIDVPDELLGLPPAPRHEQGALL